MYIGKLENVFSLFSISKVDNDSCFRIGLKCSPLLKIVVDVDCSGAQREQSQVA